MSLQSLRFPDYSDHINYACKAPGLLNPNTGMVDPLPACQPLGKISTADNYQAYIHWVYRLKSYGPQCYCLDYKRPVSQWICDRCDMNQVASVPSDRLWMGWGV